MSYPPIPCAYCGTEFVPRQYNQRFCSPKCNKRAERNVQLFTRICPDCGKEFETVLPQQIHCSFVCRNKHQNALRKAHQEEARQNAVPKQRKPHEEKYPGVCAECGKEFLGKHPDAIYCSSKCRHRAQERRHRVTRNLREYAETVDGLVAEAQASWGSEYPDLNDETIYGNMVAL